MAHERTGAFVYTLPETPDGAQFEQKQNKSSFADFMSAMRELYAE
jgi:hypothetical protein